MESRSRYYSPSGQRKEAITQEIVDAIHANPNQDPSKTVEERRSEPVSPYDHLDIVIPMTEMARDGRITYNPKTGWETELSPSTDIDLNGTTNSETV